MAAAGSDIAAWSLPAAAAQWDPSVKVSTARYNKITIARLGLCTAVTIYLPAS